MSENQIDELKAEISRLHTQVDASAKEIAALQDTVRWLNKELTRCVKDICEEVGDAFLRIKLLENKVYPGLIRDLSSVNKIIKPGEERPGGDDLDKR